MTISNRVAALVLAKDYFIIRDILGELQGETIVAKDLPEYNRVLQEAVDEYEAAAKKVEGQLTPGISSPKAGEYGRDLQRARRKGSKARARIEVAKYLQKSGLKEVTLSSESRGDFLVMKNPQEVLDGETISVAEIGKYKATAKKLEEAYKAQKLKNSDLSGSARGKGGQELARLGEEKRKAQARVDVAEQLKSRHLSKVTY